MLGSILAGGLRRWVGGQRPKRQQLRTEDISRVPTGSHVRMLLKCLSRVPKNF